MTRPRSALAAALLSGALLGGCVGGGDATQNGVRDKVEDRLVEAGASPEVAADIAGCVSRTMFESTEDWTKDERNAVNRSSDGDPPAPALVAKFTALVDSCTDEASAVGPDAGDEGDEDDEESTTTTEE